MKAGKKEKLDEGRLQILWTKLASVEMMQTNARNA
jgi:hypothetical protein